MHMVGVLYEALWEPVFTLSSEEHLKSAQRSWIVCSLSGRLWSYFSVIVFPPVHALG